MVEVVERGHRGEEVVGEAVRQILRRPKRMEAATVVVAEAEAVQIPEAEEEAAAAAGEARRAFCWATSSSSGQRLSRSSLRLTLFYHR